MYRRTRLLTAAGTALLVLGVGAVPAAAGPTTRPEPGPVRILEDLDRGLVAVPSGDGTFLSWRLLGTEYGGEVAFNVYRNGRLLNRRPLTGATNYQDDSRGRGTYSVRAVVRGREEQGPVEEALSLPEGQLEIPLSEAGGYYVQHAWPGDLDGDGRYEIVVSRLPYAAGLPNYVEAYALDGRQLWRIDLGPGSFTRAPGNGANDPPPAAVSGYGDVAGFRNDDNLTVYDLDSDGRAEVLLHTAAGVTFADGATVTAADPAEQFVSVVDGLTGAERVRRPLPDDLAADGPSGGHFGIAYLDGVHPSLVTKLVTREGAGRGGFRALFATWDFDGRELTPRWSYEREAGTSFHQIRVADVDGDGRDDIADGNYVVSSEGELLYVVEDSTHGDRFHIGDLDPDRPGLEGYAIQQTEGGVWTRFPWYYYDAATGERLVTGEHPDTEPDAAAWDIPRGTTADIDPRHRGYEFWAQTESPGLPGAGVWNVDGERVSTDIPSVNFAIQWDGDTGSELLDGTHVDGWDWRRETSTRLFDAEGTVPSWREAVPFYGDILGDWREEILAETADHTALRLFTTTEPTRTRLHTLAHDPQYRLAFTVRGYLQSNLTGFHLGHGSRSPAPPAITTDTGPHRAWTRVAADDFRSGTGQWSAELQSGGSVTAADGVLDIDVPGGATVWLRQELEGPYEIEFTATPVYEGGPNDHVTDLNTFWNARDSRSPGDIFGTARSGAFADYDYLNTYYVGLGANLNTTTRFRRYIGEPGNRPLIHDYTEPLLEANAPHHTRIVSDGSRVEYWNNGEQVFEWTDQDPYRDGWFAFRTVASHFRISDFTVWRPPADA